MTNFERTDIYSEVDDGLKTYIMQVFRRMGMGLFLTAATAYAGYQSILQNGLFARILFSDSILPTVLLLGLQLGICIYLSAKLTSLSSSTASALFYAYAILTGVTFSVLPITFGEATVFGAFLFSSVLFGCCLVIGHTTQVDLSRFQGLLIGGLLALVITGLVSLFVPVFRNMMLYNYFGVLIFLGLTAWDMQKLKAFYYHSEGFGEFQENLAIYGALQLYLDFINLFLYVIRILGNRRRD